MASWNGVEDTESGIGDLYTLPNPATIEENPRIGLIGRNEIDLPRAYKDFAVKNLTAENINGDVVDIRLWAEYPAVHSIEGELDGNGHRQYNISGFEDITCSNIRAYNTGGTSGTQGVIVADTSVATPLVNTIEANVGDFLLYSGSLNVKGGTNLDGGSLHGTTIGSLPVEDVNTVRFEVLPVGIYATCVAPLPIEITTAATLNLQALGVATLTSGGIVNLAAGTRIELDTGRIQAKNSLAGNDHTDLYIGNIHPAIGGNRELQINAGNTGYGVEITNGTYWDTKWLKSERVELPFYTEYATWNSAVYYPVGSYVVWNGLHYYAWIGTQGLTPDLPIPNWVNGVVYVYGNVVMDTDPYLCILNGGSGAPSTDPTHWIKVENATTSWFWNSVAEQPNRDTLYFRSGSSNYYGLYSPNGDAIWIAERNGTTDALVRNGQLYDSVINPVNSEALIVDADIEMNGYGLHNVGSLVGNAGNIDVYGDLVSTNSAQIRDFTSYKALSSTLAQFIVQTTTGGSVLVMENDETGYKGRVRGRDLIVDANSGVLTLSGNDGIQVENTTAFGGHDVVELGQLAFGTTIPAPILKWDTSLTPPLFAYSAGVSGGAIASDWWRFPAGDVVDMDGNSLSNVPELENANAIIVRCGLDMLDSHIDNVDTLTGKAGVLSVDSELDMKGNIMSNVAEISNGGSSVVFHDNVSLNGNDIQNVARIALNEIYGNAIHSIQVKDQLDMTGNDIVNVGFINGNPVFQYGEFSNTGTITLTTSTPTRLPFTTGSATGFHLDGNGDVVCDTTGIYRVILGTALSKSGGGTAQVDVWFRLNGTDIVGSNQRISITNASGHDSLTTSRIVSMANGHTLTCMFASTDNSVVALSEVAQTSPYAHPSSPSVCINLVCI